VQRVYQIDYKESEQAPYTKTSTTKTATT